MYKILFVLIISPFRFGLSASIRSLIPAALFRRRLTLLFGLVVRPGQWGGGFFLWLLSFCRSRGRRWRAGGRRCRRGREGACNDDKATFYYVL